MSQDVFIVGSTIRIPLLYRGEYSQWVERFINYLEEQTDGETMINLIKNGDQPLPRVTQVSIAGTTSTEQPPLKDKSMCNKTTKDLWDALAGHMLGSEYGEQDRKAAVLYEYETFKATEGELLLDTYIRCLQKKTVVVTSDPLALIAEKTHVSKSKEKVVVSSDSEGSEANDFKKRVQKIDRLARSLLIQGLLNDIYSLIDSNKTAKDLWDALARHMLGSEYGEQDRKAAVFYEYKMFKATEGELLLDNYEGSEANDFSELKKITALLAKA
nr:hypothetical protein [Tanacetum cinerariifolium]